MGFMKPKAPNTGALMKAQEDAAERERARLEQEESRKSADSDKKALAELEQAESARRAFAGGLADEEDVQSRKRFLKGV